jgi:hypothetical protein
MQDQQADAFKWLAGVRDNKVVPTVTDSSPDSVGATRDGGYAVALHRRPEGGFSTETPRPRW